MEELPLHSQEKEGALHDRWEPNTSLKDPSQEELFPSLWVGNMTTAWEKEEQEMRQE